MKKLMCAMAAIAAGVAMADVTSANIVGYQNIGLNDGKQAISCGFVKIGAESDGVYLTDLIPDCEKCDGDIVIEMLDDAGVAKHDSLEVYYYFVNSRGNDDGWWNDEDELIGEDVDDVFFPAGTGLWVTGMDDSTWRQAGQVYDADKEIPLADGKQMLSNPYPTALSLSENIWIDCEKSDGDVVIEMLDDAGVAKHDTLEVYYFFYNSRGNDDGWWNDEDELIGEDVDDVFFPAGQGLWITGLEDMKFQITSPLK